MHGLMAQAQQADVLHSDRDTMRAWERFLAGESAVAVPSALIASWQRSLESGVNPSASLAPFAVHGDAIEALRWRHRELLAASDRLFAATADLFADSHSMLLLTNQDGVILKAAGDLRTLTAGEKIHLTTGGDWREAMAGTNGIGTALATGEPTYIHASEHFCEGIKSWSCAAAPICEPGTGAIIGVLDISGPPSTYQINNLTLAITAARQIEMVLAEQSARQHMRLLAFCLQRLSSSDAAGMIAIDRRGRLVHTTGRVPLPVGIGERFPGMNENSAVEDWARHLPQGLRAEWFSPVVVEGSTIGAMLVVPAIRSRSSGKRTAERINAFGNGARGEGGSEARNEAGNEAGSEADPQRNCFAQILGQSAVMLAAVNRGRQLARRRVPVLIEGETGVGKELFARAIHGEERGGGAFVAYNCGAASRELIGSELFGHVHGAFTGATAEGRPGRFELAHGGTLCLDEIGELPLELQPVLLRALEEGVVYRLGDTQPRHVDVRLLAMTNRNLHDEVKSGRFRGDLYYRISVTRIRIPPLRERDIDIDLLVEHFNRRLALRHAVPLRRLNPEVMAVLRAYSWPGNVREMRNIIENLLLTSREEEVGLDELPAELLAETATVTATEPALLQSTSLEETERAAIARAVYGAHGNLAQAARSLGVSRSTLYRKLEIYQLEGTVKPAME
ncbi:Acetoin dehydrogenase operon transcriptional activator AcoR (plasmid) [Caballeronia sp. SBC1]|uniref:sigma-54-dependent Fis family transcriptional regulator n=1 Tax=unclassified Caballeronia TaxID=2646786 RepID=UPI0013E11856|nr:MULTISPECIES: sigma-54-dependent Fis family transcriptional regulator [unclassified Caballeronia]QIE28194.1 Acetoin dehydrogenase operon transcriptional activator AcoR [Caballeronia sp. SBC2]QIN66252.1 Acetoin dehydrogenase operon transcriptional activator AcoR [Caballeronia sp. SBC1]